MRLFLILVVLLFSSCTSKEEKARMAVIEQAAEQQRQANIEQAEKDIVKHGRVILACRIAANAKIPVKKERYTAFRTQVVGSKTTGGGKSCWTDVWENVHCNNYKRTKDITQQVPYEETSDANGGKRYEFEKACGCKNKGFNYSVRERFYIGDITYAEKFLINDWKKAASRRQECFKLKDGGTGCYSSDRDLTRRQQTDLPLFIEILRKEKKTHCMAKEDYFKKQRWYKKIPIVKHK